jgi:hypothetical protein
LRIEISNAEQTLDAFVRIGVLAQERRNDNRAIEAAISALCQRGYRAIKAERENGCLSWSRKSEQRDKWSFCLTAGKIDPRIRRDDEQTSTAEPHSGFQGEGGAGRRQG